MFDLQSAHFTSAVEAPQEPPEQPSYWYVFQEQQMLVRSGPYMGEVPRADSIRELDLDPIRIQYMGYLQDAHDSVVHCFSAEIGVDQEIPDGMTAQGLRELHPQIGDMHFGLAGRAVQIVNWDRTHQFCGQCGTPMSAMSYERAKQCPTCGLINYPRLSPAIIIAVTRTIDDERRILLARNHRFPTGRYSVVAGFVEPGESLEQTAHREVLEETGIRIKNVRYFGSQPWPFPNSLMIGFTAEYESGDFELEEAEIADTRWFNAHDLPHLPPKISIARKLIDSFHRAKRRRTGQRMVSIRFVR